MAKISRGDGSLSDGSARARREYETLCALQRVFPQDKCYGTLVPLGCLESSGREIMITRHFHGDDLAHRMRVLDERGAQDACHAAGVWLRKLHASNDVGTQSRVLGVEDKLGYLTHTYAAVLRADQKTWAAYQRLERAGAQIGTRALQVVLQHGDFKPQNLLSDGTRYVGLDIHWDSIGAPVYDLAPFLNHLWLAGPVLGTSIVQRRQESAESGFLTGYGNVGDMQALRWAQLYFALCHLGAYRRRGRLAGSYMNWKLRPFAVKLATQLEELF